MGFFVGKKWGGENNPSCIVHPSTKWWLFSRCVDDKTERRFTYKRLFCGCLFLLHLTKIHKKNYKIIGIVLSFPLVKKHGAKIMHLNYMFLWLCLMWIFFSHLFASNLRFFHIEFFDREKIHWNWPGKGCLDREFRAQSYEFVWCKAINHPNNLRKKHFDAFFPLFPQVWRCKWQIIRIMMGREREKNKCNICAALQYLFTYICEWMQSRWNLLWFNFFSRFLEK